MKIAAVIVTYNRLKLLSVVLDKFDKQTRQPDYYIVINNGSTDGTAEFLETWKSYDPVHRWIVNSIENTGGAGGFYEGLKMAMTMDVDWIWVSDDDAIPQTDALSIFERYCESNSVAELSAISAKVVSYKKTAIGYHRRIERGFLTIKETVVPLEEYDEETFEFDLFPYCGTLIKKQALEKAGLPIKDYFIQWDDSEHSIRIGNVGRIICIPKMVVNHDVEYDAVVGYQWKDYYLIRNRMDAIKRNYPKRYSIVINIRRIGQIILAWMKPDKVWAKLFTQAVTDAWKGNMGLNSIYKPGWKPHR